MKKLISVVLVVLLVLSVCACGSSGVDSAQSVTEAASGEKTFRVGYGVADVTPREPVPMSGYGNSASRISTGMYTYLYMRVLAVDDGENTLLLMTIDNGWFGSTIAEPIIEAIGKEYGIPEEYIMMQGTHTHAAPDSACTEIPEQADHNVRVVEKSVKAVGEALADLKPAEIYVGSVETENMNFVRRYIMDDGSLVGDNYPGTGKEIVAHESEVDNEIQLMKFVREGGEDVLIINFQAHPQLETRSTNISGQTPVATCTAVEERLGINAIYWQGAAGNINSQSRIESEMRTTDRNEYGKLMADYIEGAYNNMEKVNSGPVKVSHRDVTCVVNHTEDHLVAVASEVNNIWKNTNNSSEAMKAGAAYGIKSVYHASAIISRAGMGDTKIIPVAAFSFGDVSGVVVPYEMFDTSGMQIKEGTPFTKTFIFGYARPGSFSYMPDEKAFVNVGYEGNQCRYVRGTAEQLVGEYLDMLDEMKK